MHGCFLPIDEARPWHHPRQQPRTARIEPDAIAASASREEEASSPRITEAFQLKFKSSENWLIKTQRVPVFFHGQKVSLKLRFP